MPIYEYQCDECGHLFEQMRKRTDPGPEVCPECGADDPRRAISATGFQLKGSGWYVTDYKSPPASKTDSTPKEGAPRETTSSNESSDGDASDGDSSSESDSADPAPASRNVA